MAGYCNISTPFYITVGFDYIQMKNKDDGSLLAALRNVECQSQATDHSLSMLVATTTEKTILPPQETIGKNWLLSVTLSDFLEFNQ